MIDTKELRINNWVLINGNPEKIDNISEFWVNRSFYEGAPGEVGSWLDDELKNINPIRLTLVLLKTFPEYNKEESELESHCDHVVVLGSGSFKFKLTETRYIGEDPKDFDFSIEFQRYAGENYDDWGFYVEHLHELQNIYFALTRNELKIEL